LIHNTSDITRDTPDK